MIVALRTRTIAAAEAVEQSLRAQARLRAAGAERTYFKICSTFDSTDDGNIGPVADALADRLDARLTLVCPAFPANQRTVYAGHLFVGDELLSRSSMRHHPLTPMTDPDLVAVLGRQSGRPVGLLHLSDVRPAQRPSRSDSASCTAAVRPATSSPTQPPTSTSTRSGGRRCRSGCPCAWAGRAWPAASPGR